MYISVREVCTRTHTCFLISLCSDIVHRHELIDRSIAPAVASSAATNDGAARAEPPPLQVGDADRAAELPANAVESVDRMTPLRKDAMHNVFSFLDHAPCFVRAGRKGGGGGGAQGGGDNQRRAAAAAAEAAAAARRLGVTVLWGVCRTMRDYFRSPAFDTTRRKTLRVARAAAQATLRRERWTDEMIENAPTWRNCFVRCVRRRRPNTTPAATPRAPAAAFASAPRRRCRRARAIASSLTRAARRPYTCAQVQGESRLHEAARDGKVRRA